MKFVIMALISIAAASASAKTIICVDKSIQDASLAATLNLSSKGASVKLFVPTGETSGKNFDGECRSNPNAIEMDMTCNVMTSTDSGYEIKFFSIGDGRTISSFTAWSMAGNETPFSLPCE